jgi:hypothetical protein
VSTVNRPRLWSSCCDESWRRSDEVVAVGEAEGVVDVEASLEYQGHVVSTIDLARTIPILAWHQMPRR